MKAIILTIHKINKRSLIEKHINKNYISPQKLTSHSELKILSLKKNN